jgi:lipopolysaccharide biosynthesis glycosyltransferase
MTILKNWYFCLSQGTLHRSNHNWTSMALVAVRSCKKHTNLQPNLIYDGTKDEFTDLMEKEGVNVIYHRSNLFNDLYSRFGEDSYNLNIGLGAFLRFDIPIYCHDEYALYTDVDVIFNKPFDTDETVLNAIKNFMVAPQVNPNDYENDINSGVLVLNISHMRENYWRLIKFAGEYIKATCSDWDQGVLRKFFPASDRSNLSIYYNWKPYWGYNEKASIIHFHGPKPLAVKNRMENDEPFIDEWESLYTINKDAYLKYVDLFDSYLDEK